MDTYYIGKQYCSKLLHQYRCIWNSYYELNNTIAKLQQTFLGATQTNTETSLSHPLSSFISVSVCVAPKFFCCNFVIVLFHNMNFKYIYIDEMVLSYTVYQYSTYPCFSPSILSFDYFLRLIFTMYELTHFLSSVNVLYCVLGVRIVWNNVVINIIELNNVCSVW